MKFPIAGAVTVYDSEEDKQNNTRSDSRRTTKNGNLQ